MGRADQKAPTNDFLGIANSGLPKSSKILENKFVMELNQGIKSMSWKNNQSKLLISERFHCNVQLLILI